MTTTRTTTRSATGATPVHLLERTVTIVLVTAALVGFGDR